MTDAVLGLAANYGWADVEPFAVSLVRSGFTGKKALFVKNLSAEAVTNLRWLGFELHEIPVLEFSDPETPHGKYFPYVGRFLLIHKYLEENPGYRFAFCSDVRDVVFQWNPSAWMEEHIGDAKIVAAPEYLSHQDQMGNVAWITQGFKEIAPWMSPKMIYCSGVISGRADYIADLALGIYITGRHLSGSIWGADQPVYNTIMHQKAYADATLVPAMKDLYCINLVNLSLTAERKMLVDIPPIAAFDTHGEGEILPLWHMWNYGIPDLSQFTILHQYDRIMPLAIQLRHEYRLENAEKLRFRLRPRTF